MIPKNLNRKIASCCEVVILDGLLNTVTHSELRPQLHGPKRSANTVMKYQNVIKKQFINCTWLIKYAYLIRAYKLIVPNNMNFVRL